MNGQEWNILDVRPKAWGSPQSRLADIVLNGHPDAHGKPQVAMTADERQAILSWIDCDVPYYGDGRSSHIQLRGCRQITYSPEFEKLFAETASRRCRRMSQGRAEGHSLARQANHERRA